ncbi:hypothetical protein ABIA33_002104 [Streptacidiphilus sp. MAP12-16]|uniref:PucR family transcriptional regulator n=1 Tax=Streptacidiphilus sp. MAP12-16 TaxID=3156300 RepID=UPI0035199D4C
MSTATHRSTGFAPQRTDSSRPSRAASAPVHRDTAAASATLGHRVAAPRTVPHDRPWVALPPGFARMVRAENSRLVPEILQEIRRQIPEYAGLADAGSSAGISHAATRALGHFVDLIGDNRTVTADSAIVYRALGRGEWRVGRGLDPLQAAYRLGARLAWRRYAQVARHAGMSMGTMAVLAEAIFAYTDQMVVASVAGYAEARANATGTLRSRRQRLLKLLVSSEPADVVAAAAREAQWELPETLSAVVLLPSVVEDSPRTPASASATGAAQLRQWPEVLAHLDGTDGYLMLPQPDDRGSRERLAEVLGGQPAVVGPSVPWAQAAESLRWARTVAERLPSRILATTPGPIYCDENLSAVLLLSDQALIRLVTERCLAPLSGLTPNRRRRLEETLLAWLEASSGSAPEVAGSLGLHPQTVRQRMRRLEELFGDALTDPHSRFEIDLALRSRLLGELEVAS